MVLISLDDDGFSAGMVSRHERIWFSELPFGNRGEASIHPLFDPVEFTRAGDNSGNSRVDKICRPGHPTLVYRVELTGPAAFSALEEEAGHAGRYELMLHPQETVGHGHCRDFIHWSLRLNAASSSAVR